jgi:nucleoside-diphosphate-sugar epimerase
MSTAPFHLVLGAGQIGPLVAQKLSSQGLRVRVGRKSTAASGAGGVETVALDARDADAVARAAEGAVAVYHCANPPYDRWGELLLPLTRGIVQGTARAGARLIALDNVYMHGDTAHLHEGSPVAPRSKKGVLRAEAAALMLDADARGDLRVALGRAADFFGPSPLAAIFGERFWQRVLAGKSAECFGDPAQPHSYSYVPDVAAGLVALGTKDDARGVWMLPVQPAEPTAQVIERFGRALGRTLPVSRVPTWLLRALGLVNPMMREVAEMTYQWEQPYRIDDAKFRAAFGFGATPWDEAVAATVAWAKATYGAARAA